MGIDIPYSYTIVANVAVSEVTVHENANAVPESNACPFRHVKSPPVHRSGDSSQA
jgi:hypothetical protein